MTNCSNALTAMGLLSIEAAVVEIVAMAMST